MLSENSENDYENSPVKNLSNEEQVEYWKTRAEFFEKKAYDCLQDLRNLKDEEEEEGDWWRHCDD